MCAKCACSYCQNIALLLETSFCCRFTQCRCCQCLWNYFVTCDNCFKDILQGLRGYIIFCQIQKVKEVSSSKSWKNMTLKNVKTTDYKRSLKMLLLRLQCNALKLFAHFLGFGMLRDSDVSVRRCHCLSSMATRGLPPLERELVWAVWLQHLEWGSEGCMEQRHFQTPLVFLWEAAACGSYSWREWAGTSSSGRDLIFAE